MVSGTGGEIGYQWVLLKSDNEPSVMALTGEVSRRRQADSTWTSIIEEIPLGKSQVVGVVEHTSLGVNVEPCAATMKTDSESFSFPRCPPLLG